MCYGVHVENKTKKFVGSDWSEKDRESINELLTGLGKALYGSRYPEKEILAKRAEKAECRKKS